MAKLNAILSAPTNRVFSKTGSGDQVIINVQNVFLYSLGTLFSTGGSSESSKHKHSILVEINGMAPIDIGYGNGAYGDTNQMRFLVIGYTGIAKQDKYTGDSPLIDNAIPYLNIFCKTLKVTIKHGHSGDNTSVYAVY